MPQTLTAREVQVMRASARHGGSAKLIAAELGIAERTVYEHRRMIYRKLGADGAIDAFGRLGWLRVPDA